MEKETILKEFKKKQIDISEKQAELFIEYMSFLTQENKKYNLTAITGEEDVLFKHFIDSCLACILIKDGDSVIDIGAGAGFPSIPLAILKPKNSFLLVDSIKKKTLFLNLLIERLKLTNCEVICSRSEDLALNTKYREKFDICVARAVAKINTLSELCLPFIKIGGQALFYKSREVISEIAEGNAAIKTMGAKEKDILRCDINGMERNIVILEKETNTPKEYPRKQNKSKTNPL